MEPAVVGGEVPAAAVHLAILAPAARLHPDLGSQPFPVPALAAQAQGEPMAAARTVISQHQRRPFAVGDDEVDIAVVVDVAGGGAAADERPLEVVTRARGGVAEV